MFARQEIRLPGRSPRHPLLRGLEAVNKMGITASSLSRMMGVTPQTLHIWKRKTQADRHFLLPAEQIPVLARTTGIEPNEFRPDLWKKGWVF